ncbi:MAG: hypothetical protein E6Q78_10520 [Rhodoferax sp.]|nr:MAG: hypothetical protein E6Q78_10520 [Rhodoferax sp.]
MFREEKERYARESKEESLPPLNSAFKLAASLGVLASLRMHISRNDALDARDALGQTPLMIAAKKNRSEACRLLLEAGADMSLIDLSGSTAMDLALAAGAQEAMAVFALFAQVAPVPSDTEPDTLHASGAPTFVEKPLALPVTANANLEGLDSDSWTPLDERPPPADIPTLRELASGAQRTLSTHQAKDSSVVQWEDVAGYLPSDVEIAGIPFQIEERLRETVLMGLREGAVQDSNLSDLLTEVDTSTPDTLSRLTVQMFN